MFVFYNLVKCPSLGLSNIIITGDSVVMMGKQYTYTCSATCIPSCAFTWRYMGKTLNGSQILTNKTKFASQLEITVSDYSKSEPLTCEVTNTVSLATITATKNLTDIGEFVMLLPPDVQQILFWFGLYVMV